MQKTLPSSAQSEPPKKEKELSEPEKMEKMRKEIELKKCQMWCMLTTVAGVLFIAIYTYTYMKLL